MYSVEHNNVFIALVPISFGLFDHHQASAVPNLKRLDVHGSVHHNIHRTEITNKTRPCSRIYYSDVS